MFLLEAVLLQGQPFGVVGRLQLLLDPQKECSGAFASVYEVWRPDNIVKVVPVAGGAVAISGAGEVYAIGRNTHNRFGGDAPDEFSEFTRISFFQGKNVTDVAADPVRDTLLFVVDQREGYASGEQIGQNAAYADFTKLFEYADVQTVQFAQSLVYVLADQAVRYYGVCRNGLCGVDEDGREVVDSGDAFDPSWRKLNLPFH